MSPSLDDALSHHFDELADEAPELDNGFVSSTRRRGEQLRNRRTLSVVGGSSLVLTIAVTTALTMPWTANDLAATPSQLTATPGAKSPETVASPRAPIPMPQDTSGAIREVEHYKTIEEAAQAADVSVLGTIISVQPGKSFADSEGTELVRDQFLVLNVAVDKVLTGEVNDGTALVRVEFGPFPARELETSRYEELVGRKSIYLLRLKGGGAPGVMLADPRELARNAYRLVTSQCRFDRASDGTVRAPWSGYPLDGLRFDDLVARIDAVA